MICQLENPDGRNALSGAMPHCSGDDGKLTANNKHTCQLMFLFMIVDERKNMVSGGGGRNFCPYNSDPIVTNSDPNSDPIATNSDAIVTQ